MRLRLLVICWPRWAAWLPDVAGTHVAEAHAKHSRFISTTFASKSRTKKGLPPTSALSARSAARRCASAQFFAWTVESVAGTFAVT